MVCIQSGLTCAADHMQVPIPHKTWPVSVLVKAASFLTQGMVMSCRKVLQKTNLQLNVIDASDRHNFEHRLVQSFYHFLQQSVHGPHDMDEELIVSSAKPIMRLATAAKAGNAEVVVHLMCHV